jgi:hypothetical protein
MSKSAACESSMAGGEIDLEEQHDDLVVGGVGAGGVTGVGLARFGSCICGFGEWLPSRGRFFSAESGAGD